MQDGLFSFSNHTIFVVKLNPEILHKVSTSIIYQVTLDILPIQPLGFHFCVEVDHLTCHCLQIDFDNAGGLGELWHGNEEHCLAIDVYLLSFVLCLVASNEDVWHGGEDVRVCLSVGVTSDGVRSCGGKVTPSETILHGCNSILGKETF